MTELPDTPDLAKARAPIFLVGFMAAGKTTIGKVLAQMLGQRFLDLDDLIVERSGESVKEIFERHGEARFRELETAAITACATLTDTIIALGGGAYVSDTNRRLQRAIGKTIWLDGDFDTCFSRIALDGSRPLAADKETMRALFERRQAAYAKADLRMPVSDAMSPEQIALGIIEELRRVGVIE